MIAIYNRHLSVTSSLIGVLLLLLTFTSQAALIFTGQTLDITFKEPGFSDLSDTVIAGTGVELEADVNSLLNIEKFAMIDFESINIEETSILFTLRGDGDDYDVIDSILYQDTGTRSGASYLVALSGAPFSIDSVSIGETSNVVNLMSSDVSLLAGVIYFDISKLAIGTIDGPDLGTIRLNVGFVVPIPAALPLMLSGLAGLLLFSRGRKFRQ